MIGRILLVWRALRTATPRKLAPLLVGCGLLVLHLVTSVGMALDRLFFPAIGRVGPLRPIVILGNPRTGTTLIHRFLVDHGVGVGMQVWRMIHASLTQQTILRPFLPVMKRFDPTRFHAKAAHETSLTHVDVDDVSLLARYADGFFLYGFFLAFDEEEHRDRFDPELRDTAPRDMDWLDAIWRRALVWHGLMAGRNVAKLFSFGPRLPALLRRFPEARVLYLARDPLSAIPSGMSLVTGVLDGLVGFWSLPEPIRQRHLERLYQGLVLLARRFHRDWQSGAIDHSRVRIVRYDRLMSDFSGEMAEILAHVGHVPDAALQAAIDAQDAKQKGYKSEHRYNLAKFGLTEERIRADLGEWSATFLP